MFARIVAVGLVLAVVVVLVVGKRVPAIGAVQGVVLDAFAPIQDLITSSYQEVTGTGGRTVATVDQLVQENERLRAENDRLAQEAVRAPELQRENDELRDLLGLRRAGAPWQWLPGRVIAADPSNLVRSIDVELPTTSGLVENMTVMTARGLVGKITKLGRNAARVLLVTDSTSSVNAMVQRSRARGVVYGVRGAPGASQIVMRYIPQGEEIKAGDRIVTSGLGGIFPEGIAIGQVAEVRQSATDMFQEATVEPFVDFGRLETVLVITNHQPVKLD